MLTLTRLDLNPQHAEVQRDLGDCHRLHRRLLACVADAAKAAAEDARVLYRVEGTTILVQTPGIPDWSVLPLRYVGAEPSWKRVDDRYRLVAAGMRYQFRLRANPTKRVVDRGGKWEKHRVQLRTLAELYNWIDRQAANHGFRLDGAPEDAVRLVRHGHAIGRHDQGRLTFESVTFDGRLVVTDAARIAAALRHGIGSGKGFGHGLLSLAPVSHAS